MTQYYSLPRFSLNRTKWSNKILISLFLVGVILAIGLSIYTLHHRTGTTIDGLVTYYLGNENQPTAPEIRFAKSTSEMLEFFHIHSFTLLLLIFILCHFVALTTVGEWTKVVYFALTFLAFLGMMTFPWGVRFCRHPRVWSAAALVSGFGFLTLTLAGGAAVLTELWVRPLGNGRHPDRADENGESIQPEP